MPRVFLKFTALQILSSVAIAAGPFPAFGQEAKLLPGLNCRIQAWNAQFCGDGARLVEALAKRDPALARQIAKSALLRNQQRRGPRADFIQTDSIYDVATLGLAVILDLPDIFEFLLQTTNPYTPTFTASPLFLPATAKIEKWNDARLGFNFQDSSMQVPPALLAILFEREQMFQILARKNPASLRQRDSSGNTIWHYIALTGASEFLAMAPPELRAQKNDLGLSPMEILKENSAISKDVHDQIASYLSNPTILSQHSPR